MITTKKKSCNKKKKLNYKFLICTYFWKTALPRSLGYILKYIKQKCIMDVWLISMLQAKPTLMTDTRTPINLISHNIYSNKQYSL